MLQNSNTIQPKVVVIRRRANQGFGFTLRHFIAYPPEDDPSWPHQEASDPYQVKAMETIFIKEVQPNGPAHFANLQTGDRVLMVNNTPIAGIAYSTIVSMIKMTPSVLTLHVVPKECDVLQMHYTSIAHTPESNRLAAVSITRPIPSPLTVGNGNAGAGALVPMSVASSKSFPLQHPQQQQLISYHPLPSHAIVEGNGGGSVNGAGGGGGGGGSTSRSSSIASTNSGLRSLTAAAAPQPQQHQQQQQHQQPVAGLFPVSGNNDYNELQQNLHHGALLMRGDGGFMRSQPSNITVLTRQQHQQLHQNSNNIYASPADTSDLMIRLRESIKQKEEFLKSPLPHVAQLQHQQQQQHFFPQHTPPPSLPQQAQQSGTTLTTATQLITTQSHTSNTGGVSQQQQQQQHHQHQQLSMVTAGATAASSIGARGQVRALVKQPLPVPPASSSSSSSKQTNISSNNTSSTTTSNSSKNNTTATSSTSKGATKDLLPASCDMQNFYAKNLPANFDVMINRNAAGNAVLHSEIMKQSPQHATYATVAPRNRQRNMSTPGVASSSNEAASWDKYPKDLDYLESLSETGVTNQVFERKLVSHMAKGFDPFKPLSINTSAVADPSSHHASGGGGSSTGNSNIVAMKKQPVLYESLQLHPLHQIQHKQQQQQLQHLQKQHAQHMQLPMRSVVDGQQTSRMEIHKANLATTVEYPAITSMSKYSMNAAPSETKSYLADISETNDIACVKATSTPVVPNEGVVRRFRPVSSLNDDTKPMRRISYLRATNNENDFHSDTSSITTTPTTTTTTSASTSTTPFSDAETPTRTTAMSPLATVESLSKDSLDDPTYEVVGAKRDSGSGADALLIGGASGGASGAGSRRSSVNSEIRNSIHIDGDFNGKMETKDVSTEMDLFETEMEIKSSCINGKRISEYRSWRQVKIEIKGDILKIYPSRNSKSENSVIELDIKNFNILEESVDKKKYIFRLQSKPQQQTISAPIIANLANELTLEDGSDKLASSGSSSSTSAAALEAAQQHHQQQQQQQQLHTDILFKTKSITEMKRIYGLLQWKCSLIYCESDMQGKQLAEPQKTAATASVPTTTATYCDDSVQQQQQQQQQQPQPTQIHLLPDSSPLTLSASSSSRGTADLESISDSISPVMKTRKSSSHKNIPDKDLGSPKAKNWKDLLFRRGGNHNADISPSSLASNAKTIGSIGVPLRSCPMSKNNEYVPHLVDVCTNIVETKGLGIVGIYRIPGNKAAISELSEQVNKADFSWDRCNTDVRWEDVNVVSSLLKLFIRSLPDALLPCSFYINFIEADKKTGYVRLRELKELLESLPRHSYETMKHLIRHLNRVSKNCTVNLMEPKNLAIIFGPSIIRTPNDTLEIAVKDMKHQCRIVELLLTQYDYFFENGSTPDIANISGNITNAVSSAATSTLAQSQEEQTNMLLHNVSKIERLTDRDQSSSSSSKTSRFIPNLRRRTHSKRSAVSSDTYSGESVLSLDYNTKMSTSTSTSGNSPTAASNNVLTSSSSSSKSALGARAHHRKGSLDEKDSASGSGGSGGSCKEQALKQQRSSVDISILLTDEESSNSRISDSGSMSLATITDALDSKLRNLRSGSESNDENDGSPELPSANRRHTFGQPLHLHSENIPYADESPERYYYHVPATHHSSSCVLDGTTLKLSSSCTSVKEQQQKEQKSLLQQRPNSTNSHILSVNKSKANAKLQHSATAPIPTLVSQLVQPAAASTPTASIGNMKCAKQTGASGSGRNLRFSSVYEQCCSEDDSEGSTTSDPKESSLIITSPAFFLDRYNKKRRDHRLFRSASFNCRNYSTRYGGGGAGGGGGGGGAGAQNSSSALTKDEKTDMNLTKKRQIQNKQNRSIKRRHTVGGPHDYSTSNSNVGNNSSSNNGGGIGYGGSNNCNHHHCKHAVGGATTGTGATLATTVLRRIPIPSANGNISNNQQQPPQPLTERQQNNNNGNGGVQVGDHVLEVGIRIKNINRSRY